MFQKINLHNDINKSNSLCSEIEEIRTFHKLYIFQWTHVPGKLKWISSGRGVVVGVTTANTIYYRKGMSPRKPTGITWVRIPGKLKMIDIYGDQVVGTNPGNVIFKTPVIGLPRPGNGYHTGSADKLKSTNSSHMLPKILSFITIDHHLTNDSIRTHERCLAIIWKKYQDQLRLSKDNLTVYEQIYTCPLNFK